MRELRALAGDSCLLNEGLGEELAGVSLSVGNTRNAFL